LPQRVDEALIKQYLGDELIGHISRDGTAIEARERPVHAQSETVTPSCTTQCALVPEHEEAGQTAAPEAPVVR
jgi:hypothetical protein